MGGWGGGGEGAKSYDGVKARSSIIHSMFCGGFIGERRAPKTEALLPAWF
jgi:hypothetical protein